MESSSRRAAKYAALASLVALASLGLVFPLVASRWEGVGVWYLLGWTLMTAVSVAGGSWLVALHGAPGFGFPVAMVAGMLGRLMGAGLGAVAAAAAGKSAVWAYVVGLGAAFVPLQVCEVAWFSQTTRKASSAGA